ncbi:MAG: T9SS type A sorting domain-containing protein [Bacteroidetes bacterium]|nr:T9SS type A sorting domain-containing protein [Bacteroidota bacterium]
MNGSINIFPNPTSDILNFEFSNLEFKPKNYKVYDSAGRLVLEGFLSGINQIKVEDLDRGNYFIQFSDKKLSYATQFGIF